MVLGLERIACPIAETVMTNWHTWIQDMMLNTTYIRWHSVAPLPVGICTGHKAYNSIVGNDAMVTCTEVSMNEKWERGDKVRWDEITGQTGYSSQDCPPYCCHYSHPQWYHCHHTSVAPPEYICVGARGGRTFTGITQNSFTPPVTHVHLTKTTHDSLKPCYYWPLV